MAPHRTDESLPDVIDIRRGKIEFHLLDDINAGLKAAGDGRKSLPSMIFYDEEGLNLFEEITYLDDYYLTNAEIEVLERSADKIALTIQRGAQVVELGSGNLRKIKILLDALEKTKKDIDYYALDLSLAELHRTLAQIPVGEYKHVKCHGLHGTYDDGFEWLQAPENARRPKCVMSIGSSIGNFSREDAAAFLKQISSKLSPRDLILIGIDGCDDPPRVYRAYNDQRGTTHRFYRNGLHQVNRLLGHELFKQKQWTIQGEFNAEDCRHQAFVVASEDVNDHGFSFVKGERIHVENSHKYPPDRLTRLWQEAGLISEESFTNSRGDHYINMLSPVPKPLPLRPSEYAATPTPSLEDFQQLWKIWDVVSRGMVPHGELYSKPINLRNCCLFYLGHLPTFLDIHVTKAADGKPTEPAWYRKIFERGIDPDVENPELCHAHSEVPAHWPPAEEVFDFQMRVRDRVTGLYEDGKVASNPRVAYALWIGLEHEAMHIETFLYMLLQSDKTLPPGAKPDFESLAGQARAQSDSKGWARIPEREVKLGMKPPGKSTTTEYHGWDNEMPAREARVPTFEARTHALTNGDYARYLSEAGIEKYPASWMVPDATTNGYQNGHTVGDPGDSEALGPFLHGKAVKTVYGTVPLSLALQWPVMASYDELAGCAAWMNGRIPTYEEARSIYEYVEELNRKDISFQSPQNIPAVNGHLSNDGVEESPPQANGHGHSGAENGVPRESQSLFVDLKGHNVGFQAFHPVPVTSNGNTLSGQSGMGGVWEWTSSVLERWEGFEPMEAYPVYTSDFFDGKHNIVLGGSWATHPRIAGRKSFINFFQRNYPYVWAGARVVRDI